MSLRELWKRPTVTSPAPVWKVQSVSTGSSGNGSSKKNFKNQSFLNKTPAAAPVVRGSRLRQCDCHCLRFDDVMEETMRSIIRQKDERCRKFGTISNKRKGKVLYSVYVVKPNWLNNGTKPVHLSRKPTANTSSPQGGTSVRSCFTLASQCS